LIAADNGGAVKGFKAAGFMSRRGSIHHGIATFSKS